MGNTRSRGILTKSDNGLLQNNIIEGCGMAAISIGPEYYWNEADYSQHVVIEGNTMRGNGQAGYGGGAVLVHGDGAMGNRDITVKNNHFESSYQGDVDVQWTDGVTVTGNVFSGATQRLAGIATLSPIALANVRAVTLAGNVVNNAAVYKPALIAVGANVTGLTGNDPSGIRAVE